MDIDHLLAGIVIVSSFGSMTASWYVVAWLKRRERVNGQRRDSDDQ